MLSTWRRWLLLITCVSLCIGCSLLVSTASAQPRQDVRGRGRPGAGPFALNAGGPLELLARPDVQTELELLDDQKSEVLAVAERFNARRREIFTELAGQFRNQEAASDTEREALRDKALEAFQGLSQEIEQSLSFLLPHQRKRLSQLELQFRLRGGGFGAWASPELGHQLGVTDQQRELLREKSAELGREFGQKVAELRREMQERLLADLTPEQRAKFAEMVGDPFEFQDRLSGGGPGPQPPAGDRP